MGGHAVAPAFVAVVAPLCGLFVFPVIDQRKSERSLAVLLREQESRPGEYVPFLDVRPEAYRFYSAMDCREVKDEEAFAAAIVR